MEIGKLVEMLALAMGVALAVIVAGLGILWKVRGRERWMAAVTPLALGVGFVAGYALLLEFPGKWPEESWKIAVVIAGVAGVGLFLMQMIPNRGVWVWARVGMLAVMGAVATWLATIWLHEFRAEYAEALAGGLVVYALALWPAARDIRVWATGPLVMMISGIAATMVTIPWVDQNTLGRLIAMVTALSGMVLVLAMIKPLRAVAGGAMGFLAILFGAVMVLVAYANGDDIPLWVFAGLAAGPVGAAVAWVPWLRRRPWRCALAAAVVTLGIVIPFIVVAAKHAPVLDG